jgi:hypothetical protein
MDKPSLQRTGAARARRAETRRMIQIVRGEQVGDSVTVGFIRNGKPQRVEAILTRLRQ